MPRTLDDLTRCAGTRAARRAADRRLHGTAARFGPRCPHGGESSYSWWAPVGRDGTRNPCSEPWMESPHLHENPTKSPARQAHSPLRYPLDVGIGGEDVVLARRVIRPSSNVTSIGSPTTTSTRVDLRGLGRRSRGRRRRKVVSRRRAVVDDAAATKMTSWTAAIGDRGRCRLDMRGSEVAVGHHTLGTSETFAPRLG